MREEKGGLCVESVLVHSGLFKYFQQTTHSASKIQQPASCNFKGNSILILNVSAMSTEEIIHAYRHLYRAALQAVCHSKPASFVVRDQLRRAFRKKEGATFDGKAIRRTVWFLRNAATQRGMEHQIVRNLLLTQFWRVKEDTVAWKRIVGYSDKQKRKDKMDVISNTAYVHYEQTITMLNKTMGMCLPLR